jgi:hypothetical protein
MNLPGVRSSVWRVVVALLFVGIVSGAGFALRVVYISLEAERNLLATVCAFDGVERFVSECKKWPASWAELREFIDREGPSDKRALFLAPETKRRVTIEFGSDLSTLADQNPMKFTAIRPNSYPKGPYYEWRPEWPERLQATIRRVIHANGGDKRVPHPC